MPLMMIMTMMTTMMTVMTMMMMMMMMTHSSKQCRWPQANMTFPARRPSLHHHHAVHKTMAGMTSASSGTQTEHPTPVDLCMSCFADGEFRGTCRLRPDQLVAAL